MTRTVIVALTLLLAGCGKSPTVDAPEPAPPGEPPGRTPAPSNVVVVPEEAAFKGSIVYAKGGNIWIQTDDEVHQLTDDGHDSMPAFSEDGEWVYFNSARTSIMRIWRMRPDGSEQQQVTFDEQYGDWFPHPSPDGKWLVLLSYDRAVEGHPPNQHVCLRIMPLSGGRPEILLELFGGQGTINVPSWSPDSSEFAFVSYRLLGA